jgi:hypothetical protein
VCFFGCIIDLRERERERERESKAGIGVISGGGGVHRKVVFFWKIKTSTRL